MVTFLIFIADKTKLKMQHKLYVIIDMSAKSDKPTTRKNPTLHCYIRVSGNTLVPNANFEFENMIRFAKMLGSKGRFK